MQMIDDFEKEIECIYKGETYSVRDNGAVMRHSRTGKRHRSVDNNWTFGKYNDKTGYAEIAGERVHRIVATAFHGAAPNPQYVVDHIDTNRRNNRPENLRWITKLENAILNPITAKKIVLCCGSIEEFLRDPSKLQQSYEDRDFEWMRAVSKEEAATSLERLLSWAKSDKFPSGGALGEWIYRRRSPQNNSKHVEEYAIFPSETLNTALNEREAKKQIAKPVKISKTNPFNFPRTKEPDSDNAVIMYKTSGELFGMLKTQLELEKKLKLPDIILPAGNGMVVKTAWIEEYIDSNYCYEGKSRIPKSIILRCKDSYVALLIRIKASVDEKEKSRLQGEGFNIVEIDLSWAKDGVTESEMKYILQTDITKKRWIYHEQLQKAKEALLKICEPIVSSGKGVFHSYFACPIYLKSVQDIECLYCNYRYRIGKDDEEATCNSGYCFGKSRVNTYQELLSITDVEKENERIVGITYNDNGKTVVKKFDENGVLPGKTLFQLWRERTDDKLIAHNIYSDWYVFIEEDPIMCFNKTKNVYGKLGRSVKELENKTICQIFNFDSNCWEIVKE